MEKAIRVFDSIKEASRALGLKAQALLTTAKEVTIIGRNSFHPINIIDSYKLAYKESV